MTARPPEPTPEAPPTVSVVIPAHDAERFVADAIESVLAQTYPAVECVVVDDGSTDRTAEIARGHGAGVLVITQQNQGVAAARNRGVVSASGSLLSFLDADDVWVPDRTERLVARLEAEPALDAVVSASRIVDSRLEPIAVHRHSRDVSLRSILLFEGELVSTSSNLLIRRDAFDRVGGFDTRLSTAADWALALRLVDLGRLGYVDKPLTLYRRHDANMSHAITPMEHDMRRIYDELFADRSRAAELGPIRRRAYARLHRVLAGSYFGASQWRGFARNAVLSVAYHPAELGYFLGMPLRRARRGDLGDNG